MSRTVAELASKCYQAPRALQTAQRRSIGQAAFEAKKIIQAGAPDRLRNVGKGARLNVRYDVRGVERPVALVRAVGPWQIIEASTKPHTITPRRRGRRALASAARRGERGSNRQALAVPGVGPRASVQHPGTHGKYQWRRGVEAAKQVIPRQFQATMKSETTTLLRGVFR